MNMTTMMKKKKNTLVFSIFTFTFAAAILHIFSSQSSFWKNKKKKKIQQQEEEEEEDRISELPKEILVHILGFLEMDEMLIRTSLVSTKWRNLWKSVSNLNFSHGHGSSSSISSDSVEKYQNFVDHVLRLRDSESSKIRIFKYNCHNLRGGYDYLERFHDFIVSAVVNQGAQEIQVSGSYIIGPISDMFHFNPSIFTSGGLLRKFTFQVCNHHRFLIQFPRSMCSCATQLTHLSLYDIRLPEGDESNAQLHLVCPLLETLVICNCYCEHLKVLDVSAPRLNSLSICNYGMRSGNLDRLGGCRIEIRTPNLISLDYRGDVYVDCFTENLPRIAKASLYLTKEPGPGMVEQTTSFAIKLLKGLTNAERLILDGFEIILKDLLTPFTSLTTLSTSCKISSIHEMAHFLSSCSSIKNLLLLLEVDEFVEMEGEEHLMLPQCRLSHLKHVRIKGLCGHENEIEFVKFLLKSSVVLEEIIIQTIPDSPKQSIEENLKQFIEEEPSIRMRSIKLCVLQDES